MKKSRFNRYQPGWMLTALLMVFCMSACRWHTRFEKQKWNERDPAGLYPNRRAMLHDLMQHHLKGLSYQQVVSLIGEPDGKQKQDPGKLWYNIEKEFNANGKPVYIKNLLIRMGRDSVVYRVGIEVMKTD